MVTITIITTALSISILLNVILYMRNAAFERLVVGLVEDITDTWEKMKQLDDKQMFEKDDEYGKIQLTVTNPSDAIAFFLFLDVVDANKNEPILPVYWDDNYISLLPGEDRTYNAYYFLADSDGTSPIIKIKGWNVDPVILR